MAKYRKANGGSGTGLVPLLEHKEKLVIESDAVTKYIATNVAMTDTMYPVSSRKVIDRFLHQLWYPLTDSYYDLLCASSIKEVCRFKRELIQHFRYIEDDLAVTDGEFLLGDTFSVTECICAPWIQRFFVTLPYFRGIDFQSEVLNNLPRTSIWIKSVCKRQSVLKSKCADEEIINAAKRYYVSFISPGATGKL